MRSLRFLCTALVALAVAVTAFAKDGETTDRTVIKGQEVRFHSGNSNTLNLQRQQLLREDAAWQKFYQQSGWWVEFNEVSGMPHRAYGAPIATAGADPETKVRNFMSSHMGGFNIPQNELMLRKVYTSEKYTFVNFTQQHQGLEVLFSNATARLVPSTGAIILFGADVYNNISLNTSASLSGALAQTAAQVGITDPVVGVTTEPDLKVLPIVHKGQYEFHLVYECYVKTYGGEVPGNYYTLVDAHDGTVLYRANKVHTTSHKEGKEYEPVEFKPASPAPLAVNVHMEGTITDNPGWPTAVRGLQYMDVQVGGPTNQTDINGDVGFGSNPPQSANYQMEGDYCRVYDGQTGTNMATFSNTLSATNNTVSFDASSLNSERSAYYHVNAIHTHMKNYTPVGFTTLDGVMLTRVERTDGNCNAFYNGNINFYAAGGNCPSTALFHDVVYHEYGHGINYDLYNYYGGTFTNGALGEGYADVWAMTLTDYAIVGEGFQGPGTDVRRYDINPKIYPQDLVGEVHADGEIICGAWWDLYQLDGNLNFMTTLWQATHPATLTQPNGNEGVLYRDILLETLIQDDIDANIFNGTPNDGNICQAFGMHGITLLSNATLTHAQNLTATPNSPITVDAVLNIGPTTYLGNVMIYYRFNNNMTWSSAPMNNPSSNNYTFDIPGQPDGTIVHYYMAILDNVCGNPTGAVPIAADATPANMPYNIMVGFTLQATDDFDFNFFPGSWQAGLAGDDATTGQWELNIPIPSYGTPGDTSTKVQTYYQHTPGGSLCMLTGNAGSPNDPLGTNDVDAGVTTLQSPVIDLSSYTNPAITYFRWYINNPPSGANPNADWWEMHISNDGGSTWTPVEVTRVSDARWRRTAIRVLDFTTPTNQMVMRFYVADSLEPTEYLNGGSLVEGALDDVQIWDAALPLSTSSTQQATTCNGGSDGQGIVTASGGTTPYTYLWDASAGSQTTATATGLSAGTYCCTVTDNNLNTSVECVTVTEPTAMTSTSNSTGATCGNNNGDATVTASNGTAPYTYQWDAAAGNQTTQTANGLGGGSYNVTVTDANGCTVTDNVTVSSTPAVAATTGVNDATCGANDGDATVTATAGPAPYTYQWDAAASSQTTQTATGLGAGTYTVTVVDANGCSGTFQANVSNSGAPSITANTNTGVTCNAGTDGAVDITVSGGTTPYTYLWDDPSSSTTEDISSLGAGTYTVTITDNVGCVFIQSYTITEPAAISATDITTDATCNGDVDGSVDITVSGGTAPYTYLWDDPSSSTTEDLTGVGAGSYNVTVTDANGCTSIQSYTISEPTAIASSGTVVDNQQVGSIDLTVSGGAAPYTYNWSGPNSYTSTNEDLAGLTDQGTYIVTITDATGCTEIDTFIVAGIVTVGDLADEGFSYKVYPNPSNGVFNLFVNSPVKSDYKFEVRNVLGQVVTAEQVTVYGNVLKPIDMGDMSRGVYFLTISNGKQKHTEKIILN